MADARMKKVILISSNRWNSAITEYLISTAAAFELLGYEVEIAAKDNTIAMERFTRLKYRIHKLSSFKLPVLLKLQRLIVASGAHLVMTFGGPESAMVNYLPLNNVSRIRFRGQNFHNSAKFRIGHWLSHFNFKHFVSPANWLAEKLNQATGYQYRKVDLGMDEEKFKFKDVERDVVTLTLVARFDPIKGHRYFFRLFAQALHNWPANLGKPILRLIGREENITIPQLRAWGKEFGIDDYISIETKKLPEIETELNRTTLAIIPSLGSEVICRSAYEFLLCGCPVFVSGVGSLNETIQSPIFGHSYLGRSEEETVEFLLSCISDAAHEKDEVRKMRAEEARKYYSTAAMAESFKKLVS